MTPIYNALIYLVWFLATYYSVFFLLSLLVYEDKIFEGKQSSKELKDMPLVSIIVPAYNEQESIADTIKSLKHLKYLNTEFILINDGSKDNTSKIVRENIGKDARFNFIDNIKNQGKAACLNEGIKAAKGKYIACMDADSVIEEEILQKTIPYFNDENTGCVTVSVRAKNVKTILHKIIDLEYTLGLSLFLKVLSMYDCIHVTPGPFSIYRKTLLDEIGGFDTKNITEDHEIAFRIQKAGYKIRNCIEAKVYTILPDTFKKVYVQRRRWYSGSILTLKKHKDVMFNRKFGMFGYFIPFNYFLIMMGLIVSICSLFLALSKTIEELIYFNYTNFNFLDYLFSHNFDLLTYGRINLLGAGMLVATIVFMLVGIKWSRRKYNENIIGLLGHPFLYLLYQIYWIGAIFAVIKRKEIKWR